MEFPVSGGESDAIVEMAKGGEEEAIAAIVVTKKPEDYGVTQHQTTVPVMRIPAYAFLYLLGHAEYDRYFR